ncbi:MAG: hypothetical protein O2960_29600, partial [Verrucomicrobia bacterium]|nr:hypothetical protein [Verrucomicrobiota bacterium]
SRKAVSPHLQLIQGFKAREFWGILSTALLDPRKEKEVIQMYTPSATLTVAFRSPAIDTSHHRNICQNVRALDWEFE